MSKQKEIEKVIRGFNRNNIRYVLIGRQAVMLYGAPLFSYDYDFWVHPEDREKTYIFLEDQLEFEVSKDRKNRSPIVNFFTGTGEKIDIFYFRNATNRKGKRINIDIVLKSAKKIKQPNSNFYIVVPSIDDLIRLKRLGNRPKDVEDIEYLMRIKKIGETNSI